VLGRPLVEHGLQQVPPPDAPAAQPRQQASDAPEGVGGGVADADGVAPTKGKPDPDAGEHMTPQDGADERHERWAGGRFQSRADVIQPAVGASAGYRTV